MSFIVTLAAIKWRQLILCKRPIISAWRWLAFLSFNLCRTFFVFFAVCCLFCFVFAVALCPPTTLPPYPVEPHPTSTVKDRNRIPWCVPFRTIHAAHKTLTIAKTIEKLTSVLYITYVYFSVDVIARVARILVFSFFFVNLFADLFFRHDDMVYRTVASSLAATATVNPINLQRKPNFVGDTGAAPSFLIAFINFRAQ